MDIDLLSKMVKELILERDEVNLPGIGAFVAEMMPATFSDKGYTINPPYRRLSFRQRSTMEDNAVVELYARSNGIDNAAAEKIMTDFLGEMKSVLEKKKTLVLTGLGRLRATRENNFFFVPDEDLDIWPEGFGLESLSLKSHAELQNELQESGEQIMSFKHILEAVPVEEPQMTESPESVSCEVVEKSHEEVSPATVEEPSEESYEQSSPVVSEEQTEESHNHVTPVTVVERGEESDGQAESVDVDQPVEKPLEESKQKPLTQPEDENAQVHEEARLGTQPEAKSSKPVVLIILIVLLAIVVMVFAYVALAYYYPGIWDKWLYSAEDLEIVRQICL